MQEPVEAVEVGGADEFDGLEEAAMNMLKRPRLG